MPTVLAPPETWVLSPDDIADAEKFLEEFDKQQDSKAKRAKVKFGTHTFRSIAKGAAAGVAGLALPFALTKLDQLEDYLLDTKKRQRRKANLCIKECLEIIEAAWQDIDQLAEFRALQTDDTEYRKRRKFESRK